eukprot:10864827-Karenia_brevis.AAC.1
MGGNRIQSVRFPNSCSDLGDEFGSSSSFCRLVDGLLMAIFVSQVSWVQTQNLAPCPSPIS